MQKEQVFQILLLEIQDDDVRDGIAALESTLAWGTKAQLQQGFDIDEQELFLPSKGAEVCSDFLNVCGSNDSERAINLSMYNPIRFMLQCRVLSQLITKTWLWKESKKNEPEYQKIFCIKEILSRKFNESPNILWASDRYVKNETDMLEHLQKYVKESKDKDFSLTINPLSNPIAYKTIQLALLLAGQAYLKIQGKWVSVLQEPILSTYEIVMEYSFNVNFDSYTASRVDLVRGTEPPQPPYYQVEIPYPAKPVSESLCEDRIKLWAEAPLWAEKQLPLTDGEVSLLSVDGKQPLWVKEVGEDNIKNKLPFYPEKGNEDYSNKKLRYVNPPFAYIPLSCV